LDWIGLDGIYRIFIFLYFCIILYAGWIWMTASGNEEKIDKAKKIIASKL
jgi:cbb3-type cytochrome oxidase subunit 3